MGGSAAPAFFRLAPVTVSWYIDADIIGGGKEYETAADRRFRISGAADCRVF